MVHNYGVKEYEDMTIRKLQTEGEEDENALFNFVTSNLKLTWECKI
jgi:hypothetical protein